MKKILGTLMLTGLLLAGTACGSDEDTTETDTTEAPAAESGESGGSEESDSGDSGNSAVADYCTKAEELAEELKAVMADPTSGDAAGITAQAQELVTAAQELSGSNPDDLDAINECTQKITTALGG